MDETIGEYMSPDRIVVEQGGWDRPDAVRRGMNLVEMSMKMGGTFVRYNTGTKGWDVLYPRIKHSEIYEKSSGPLACKTLICMRYRCEDVFNSKQLNAY